MLLEQQKTSGRLSCWKCLTNTMNRLSEVCRRTSTVAAGSVSDETADQYVSVSLSRAPVAAPARRRTFHGESTVYREDKLFWCSAFKKLWFHTVAWMSQSDPSVVCAVPVWEVKGCLNHCHIRDWWNKKWAHSWTCSGALFDHKKHWQKTSSLWSKNNTTFNHF